MLAEQLCVYTRHIMGEAIVRHTHTLALKYLSYFIAGSEKEKKFTSQKEVSDMTLAFREWLWSFMDSLRFGKLAVGLVFGMRQSYFRSIR